MKWVKVNTKFNFFLFRFFGYSVFRCSVLNNILHFGVYFAPLRYATMILFFHLCVLFQVPNKWRSSDQRNIDTESIQIGLGEERGRGKGMKGKNDGKIGEGTRKKTAKEAKRNERKIIGFLIIESSSILWSVFINIWYYNTWCMYLMMLTSRSTNQSTQRLTDQPTSNPLNLPNSKVWNTLLIGELNYNTLLRTPEHIHLCSHTCTHAATSNIENERWEQHGGHQNVIPIPIYLITLNVIDLIFFSSFCFSSFKIECSC